MPISTLTIPALDNGMLAQRPIGLTIRQLASANRFLDGSVLYSASGAQHLYNWTLRYENLSTAEWQRFVGFLTATQGGSDSFLFLDPVGNLLAQSVNLNSSVWLAPPGLIVDLFADPGQPDAYILTNSTPQPLTLTQTASVPGAFTTCFSLLAKWPGEVSFSIGLNHETGAASQAIRAGQWAKHHVRLSANAAAQTRTVSITVPPTTQVIVASPQLEVAAAPNAYCQTGAQSGVFPSAWLSQERFDTQSVAPGAHSITLHIESIRSL